MQAIVYTVESRLLSYTQNPSSSAYTQLWVLYTWDELVMRISHVGKPLHELEDLSSIICTLTVHVVEGALFITVSCLHL